MTVPRASPAASERLQRAAIQRPAGSAKSRSHIDALDDAFCPERGEARVDRLADRADST